MISRSEMIKRDPELFEAYYEQFSDYPLRCLRTSPAWKAILEKARKSQDKNFNDIPLEEWYALRPAYFPRLLLGLLEACGDYMTDAGWVCIAKVAVRKQIREEKTNGSADYGEDSGLGRVRGPAEGDS